MNDVLSYCPDLGERLARLRTLYERRAPDRIFAQMFVPNPALAEFAARHPAGYSARPDLRDRAAFWDEFLCAAAAVRDDTVPSAYLTEMDQGLYGGLVGGEIRYIADPANGWISSMVPPILGDLTELERLQIDEQGAAFRYYMEALAVFRERAQGKFGISHFILIDALNFVFELVGATKTYLAATDDPELVRQAVDFAYRLNVRVQNLFFEHVPLLEGGTCSNMASWVPGGRIVSESVDPFHMTSPAYFEQWGREPVERMFSTFGGGVIHIHGNGRHLLPAVSSLRGLRAVCLFNDHGYPPAIEEVGRLQRLTGDLPLIVDVDFRAFADAMENRRLVGGALYKVNGVPDAETANRWMDRVREYRL